MSTVKKIDIRELSQSERILLAEKLRDSIVGDQESLEVTDAQVESLQQRLTAHKSTPDEGYSWESE